ncbi:uncharacterized protein NEMAJ01_0875 [Nematocida major]|uniref:uncharacterized protein n=1 Tax=Nematocida major TaxID=1912982 RepID=UPI0020081FE7|nr:uncharacterized protein NEMAJ01_0875 [Nematocida major]KAH9385979.1 hypothetical protein NEMAJ01_0875 [Nematocida major]
MRMKVRKTKQIAAYALFLGCLRIQSAAGSFQRRGEERNAQCGPSSRDLSFEELEKREAAEQIIRMSKRLCSEFPWGGLGEVPALLKNGFLPGGSAPNTQTPGVPFSSATQAGVCVEKEKRAIEGFSEPASKKQKPAQDNAASEERAASCTPMPDAAQPTGRGGRLPSFIVRRPSPESARCENSAFGEKMTALLNKNTLLYVYKSLFLMDSYLLVQGHPKNMHDANGFGFESSRRPKPPCLPAFSQILAAQEPGCSIWSFLLVFLSDAQELEKAFGVLASLRNSADLQKKGFAHYYPDFFIDCLAYVRQNSPQESPLKMAQRVCCRKKRLCRDIFAYDPIYLEHPAHWKDFMPNPHPLFWNSFAFVIFMPEVSRDFMYMSRKVFTGAIYCMRNNPNSKQEEIACTEKAIIVLEFLWVSINKQAANYPYLSKEKEKNYQRLIEKMPQKGKKAAQAMYPIIQHALKLFYKNCAAEYRIVARSSVRSFCRMLGKAAVTGQLYAKSTVSFSCTNETIVCLEEQTSLQYIEGPLSAEGWPEHYHIHFVDNNAQTYRQMCMPLCKIGESMVHIHRISDIIRHISMVFEINIYKVRALKFQHATGEWIMLTGQDLFKSVKDLTVVFYYISEPLASGYFTLAVFRSPMSPAGKIQIPLFMPPFFRSALFLSPYTEHNLEGHPLVSFHELVHKGVKPSVYVYTENPLHSFFMKSPSMLYKYQEAMYSDFYIGSPAGAPRCWEYCFRLLNSTTACWYTRVHENLEIYTHYRFKYVPGGSAIEKHNFIESMIGKIISHYAAEDAMVCGYTLNMEAGGQLRKVSDIHAGVVSAEQPSRSLCVPEHTYLAIRSVRKFKPELRIHNQLVRFFFHNRAM